MPVFETDTLVAQAQGGIARICLPTDADLQNYELLVDGVVHTQGYVPCVQDTLVYYSYALLNGGGSSGPYRVDFWDGNGTILQGITVNDMEELSVLMNLADTSANWTNDYGTRSLEGGSASGIYGNLQITHLPSQVTLEMQVNRTDVSSGSALDISGLGEHTLILRSLDSPCADTLTVLLESGQPGPRGFIGTKFEVLSMDCSEQATEYCVEDISWVDMNKYALERNGLPYEGTLGGCNYLNNHSYSYFLLPGGGVSGPYRLESWRVGGSYYSGSFATVQELASLLNSYDTQGNWQLDAGMRVIRSEGNARSDYGRLEIVQESSGIRSYLELNTNSIPSGVSLSLERGMNSFVFTRLSDGERDTLTLGLACVRSEYIYDEIEVGQVDTLCLKTEELLGAMTGVENLCPGQAASASFSVLAGTNCVVCRGMEPGMSNACLVICDEYGVCDTTYVELLVRNSASGNAGVADTLYTQQGEEVTGNVLGNDVINGAIRSLRILRQPAYGQVRVNADMTLSYVPFEAYCDEEQSDSFVYEWCGEAGDCVQAEVLVWVLCDDLRIYTGFSPNGDGINETFRIEGLERYPNHVLRIYNRWGNEVYRSRNYQSDWDGDWRGTGLPDGTYFYLLDTGEGVVRSGYVQLQR